MSMDDIKLLAKNEQELKSLIQSVSAYNDDTGIQFGIEKCAMLIIKSGKLEITEKWNNEMKKKSRMLKKMEADKYMRILEANAIKQAWMKEKKNKRVPQENQETTRTQTIWHISQL